MSAENSQGLLTRRNFLKLAAGVGACAALDVATTAARIYTSPIEKSGKSADELRAIFGPNPAFPFQNADISALSIGGASVNVIKPEALETRYGISIITKDYKDGALQRSAAPGLYIRPTENLFRSVFGSLYDRTNIDPHVIKKVEIVALKNSHLCTLLDFMNNVVAQEIHDNGSAALTKFREDLTVLQFPKLPRLDFPAHVFNYSLGGAAMSLGDNIKQLDKVYADFFANQKIFKAAQRFCLYDARGLVATLNVEFVRDWLGRIVVASDNVPMVNLTVRGYTAIDNEPKNNIDIKSGARVRHEVFHMMSTLNPKLEYTTNANEEIAAYGIEEDYAKDAVSAMEKGDNAGYLFVVDNAHGKSLSFDHLGTGNSV